MKKDIVNNEMEEKYIYGVTDYSKMNPIEMINNHLIDASPVSVKDKMYFFHILGSMIDSGVSTIKALELSAHQTSNIRLQRIANTLHYNVANGSKISDAMSRFPNVFTTLEIGIVRSGEGIGHLGKMLFRVADNLEKMMIVKRKVKGALTYPCIVFFFLIIAVIVMMIFVVPSLLGFFTESNFEVPLATQILLSVSNFFVHKWTYMIVGAILAYVGFALWQSTPEGRYRLDFMKLNLPVIGDLLKKLYIYNFVSLLSILIEAGVPLQKSLEIIMDSMKNRIYKEAVRDIKEKVVSGTLMSEGIAEHPFVFNRAIAEMINIGERTAAIDKVSMKITSQYDRELKYQLDQLATFFSVVMLLIVSIAVAITAFAILLPIFTLSTQINAI